MILRFYGLMILLSLCGLPGWLFGGIEVVSTTPRVDPDGTSEEIGGIRLIFTAQEFVQTPPDGDEYFAVIMRISLTYNKRIVSVGGQTNWQSFTPIPLVWERDSGYVPIESFTEVNSARIIGFYPGDTGTGANSYIDVLFLDDQKNWQINDTARVRITIGTPAFYTNNTEDPYQGDTRIRVDFTPALNEFATCAFWHVGLDCRAGTSFNTGSPYPVLFDTPVPCLARKGAWSPSAPMDLNGDGYIDILWRHTSSGAMADWYITGTGAAAGALSATVNDTDWQVVGCGDYNGDGFSDLVWRDVVNGDLGFWLMGPYGYMDDVYLGSVDPTWKILGAADLNDNGNADVLWRNFTDGFLSVWLMSSNLTVLGSTFAGGISDLDWKVIGSGNFDGDGRADVLWRHSTTGTMSIWFEDETGFQGDMSPGTVSTDWKITGIGDVDGNGIDDILWRSAINGDLSVWFLADGGVTTGTTFLGGIPKLAWKVKGVGDFNHDGYADILWRNTTSGAVVIWYSSGTGVVGELYLGTVDPSWETVNQANFPGASELP